MGIADINEWIKANPDSYDEFIKENVSVCSKCSRAFIPYDRSHSYCSTCRQKHPPKVCRWCGNEFKRQRSNELGISGGSRGHGVTCSRKCRWQLYRANLTNIRKIKNFRPSPSKAEMDEPIFPGGVGMLTPDDLALALLQPVKREAGSKRTNPNQIDMFSEEEE